MLTKTEIARLRSLQEKKAREALGLFVVEGEKVIRELLQAGYPFAELYMTDAAALGHRAPDQTTLSRMIMSSEMERISHLPTPSPLLAVGRINRPDLAASDLTRGLTLALDGVQDAGNVGTILRIADWFQLDRVIMSPDCADRFSPKVINASMGSFSRVPTYSVDLETMLSEVTLPILGCDLEGQSVHTLACPKDIIIVIGSEGRGLSPGMRKLVTQFITIPRYGAAESLNAGIAAAIVCDNLRRLSK